jgi:hypothetical protein
VSREDLRSASNGHNVSFALQNLGSAAGSARVWLSDARGRTCIGNPDAFVLQPNAVTYQQVGAGMFSESCFETLNPEGAWEGQIHFLPPPGGVFSPVVVQTTVGQVSTVLDPLGQLPTRRPRVVPPPPPGRGRRL